MSIDEILKCLKEDLNPERYEHSLGVAEMARELAERFACDPEKAYVAGLLHDCAKCMDFELAKKIHSIVAENLLTSSNIINDTVNSSTDSDTDESGTVFYSSTDEIPNSFDGTET